MTELTGQSVLVYKLKPSQDNCDGFFGLHYLLSGGVTAVDMQMFM